MLDDVRDIWRSLFDISVYIPLDPHLFMPDMRPDGSIGEICSISLETT